MVRYTDRNDTHTHTQYSMKTTIFHINLGYPLPLLLILHWSLTRSYSWDRQNSSIFLATTTPGLPWAFSLSSSFSFYRHTLFDPISITLMLDKCSGVEWFSAHTCVLSQWLTPDDWQQSLPKQRGDTTRHSKYEAMRLLRQTLKVTQQL